MALIFAINVLPTMAFANEISETSNASTENVSEAYTLPDALSNKLKLTEEEANIFPEKSNSAENQVETDSTEIHENSIPETEVPETEVPETEVPEPEAPEPEAPEAEVSETDNKTSSSINSHDAQSINANLEWVNPVDSLYNIYQNQFNMRGIALQEYNSYDSCEDFSNPGYIKYNIWYFGEDNLHNMINSPNTEELDWNTTFISWCADKLGYIDLGIIPRTNNCHELINWLRNNNNKHLVKGEANFNAEAITANDIIFVPVANNYQAGIVNDVNTESISYFVGDSNDMVCLNSIDINHIPEKTEIFTLNTGDDYYYEYLDFLHNNLNVSYQTAIGIMANLYAESAFMPHAYGDNGTSYGLCQWHNERWFNLIDYCDANGLDWQTAEGQLYFLKYELENNYSYLLSFLQSCDDARTAAYEFCIQFERPADTFVAGNKRADIASGFLIPTIC